MPATTIALEAIADAVEHDHSACDDANELATHLMSAAGLTLGDRDACGAEVDDELQALLVEVILRSPAVATYLGRVTDWS